MIEQAIRPSTASSRSGSSRRRHSRGTSGGGGSEAGWMGVVAVLTRRAHGSGGGSGSSGGARPGVELARLHAEPLLQDLARRGGGGLGAEAALLDRDHDDDRLDRVWHVAGVPRLIGV